MEIKAWTYDEYPGYSEEVPGAVRLKTTGDEVGVRYLHDVEYARVDDVPLHLQILLPFTRNEPDKIYPCMVFIQGSAWMEQDVWMQCAMLSGLAKKGYVIAVVQYRHSGLAPFPAQIQDARNAIRYMRVHASEYHADPDGIVVGGDSSGGHTSMFCGIAREGGELEASLFPGVSAEVKGILNYYGSVSMMYEEGFPSTVNHHMEDSPEGLLMGKVNLKEHPELCRKGSVECWITPELDMAPTMIVHGTKDRTIHTYQSVQLYEKMKACGKDVRLYLLEGADHGGAEYWTEEMCSLAHEFIQYCLNRC